MEELIGNWLTEVGINWLFAPKCSQCWSVNGLYQINCCGRTMCAPCIHKQLKRTGWIFKKTVFTCPCCNAEIKL